MNEDKMIAEINFKNSLLFIRSVSSFFTSFVQPWLNDA